MGIEDLATELRTLRRRIHAQEANPHTWPTKEEERFTDLDRYDRRLLKAAAMLGVEAPRGRGRGLFVLDDDDRTRIEQRLVEAGVDVGATAGEGAQN